MFTTQYTQSPYIKQTRFAFKGLISFIFYGCMANVQLSELYLVIYLGDEVIPDILFHSNFINKL
jgi:predicted transglutaminase-like protease